MRDSEVYKWPRGAKKSLLERDGKGCVLCWSQQRLTIHHYWEKRGDIRESPYWEKIDGGFRPRFDLNYLILLCGSCHGKVHRGYDDSPFMRLFHSIMKNKKVSPQGQALLSKGDSGEAIITMRCGGCEKDYIGVAWRFCPWCGTPLDRIAEPEHLGRSEEVERSEGS